MSALNKAPGIAPDKCRICGSADIDHGSEHMGAVEFPDSICEACYRKQNPAPGSVPDELTADERADLEWFEGDGDAQHELVAKLLRLYDQARADRGAALAEKQRLENEISAACTEQRSQLAELESERDAALARAEAVELLIAPAHLDRVGRQAAESRLTAAVAYLRVTTELDADTMARHVLGLLSSAPAQAAEPSWECPWCNFQNQAGAVACGRCDAKVEAEQAAAPGAWPNPDDGFPGLRAAKAAEPAADECIVFPEPERRRVEHPDTIALRECRADLAQCQRDLTECANARDTGWGALQLVKDLARAELEATRAELATARARIAELEAKVSEWAGRAGTNAAAEELLKMAISQAVAELGDSLDNIRRACRSNHDPAMAQDLAAALSQSERALEALR